MLVHVGLQRGFADLTHAASHMVAGLVNTGLATAPRETMKAGDGTIEVVRIRIAAAGRYALRAESS